MIWEDLFLDAHPKRCEAALALASAFGIDRARVRFVDNLQAVERDPLVTVVERRRPKGEFYVQWTVFWSGASLQEQDVLISVASTLGVRFLASDDSLSSLSWVLYAPRRPPVLVGLDSKRFDGENGIEEFWLGAPPEPMAVVPSGANDETRWGRVPPKLEIVGREPLEIGASQREGLSFGIPLLLSVAERPRGEGGFDASAFARFLTPTTSDQLAPLWFVGAWEGAPDSCVCVESRPLGQPAGMAPPAPLHLALDLCQEALQFESVAQLSHGLHPARIWCDSSGRLSGYTHRWGVFEHSLQSRSHGSQAVSFFDIYCSPEAACGYELVASSTVFVLAALLHTWTGQAYPFLGDSALARAVHIAEGKVHPFAGPPPLRDVVTAALSAEPENRPSLKEFSWTLNRYILSELGI